MKKIKKEEPKLKNVFIAPWVYATQDGRLVVLIDEWGYPILDIPELNDEATNRLAKFTLRLNDAWSEHDKKECEFSPDGKHHYYQNILKFEVVFSCRYCEERK